MDWVDRFYIALALALWGVFFIKRKNLTFGLAFGMTLFAVIYVFGNFG